MTFNNAVLPRKLSIGVVIDTDTSSKNNWLFENIESIEELFWVMKNNHNKIINSMVSNVSKNIYSEIINTITKYSQQTSRLSKEQIAEVKGAVKKYNNCYPKWVFSFTGESELRYTKINEEGKEISYNEMFANFVFTNDFGDINGLLTKVILYASAGDFPGIETAYVKRINGIAIQRTWVADEKLRGRGLDYRFFREGFRVRFFFDKHITKEDITYMINAFSKNFISQYCSNLEKPDIELRVCGCLI